MASDRWRGRGLPPPAKAGGPFPYQLVVLLRSFSRAPGLGIKQIAALTSHAFGIPVFCFGGPGVTASLLQTVRFDELLPQYLTALVSAFLLIVAYPLLGFILGTAAAPRPEVAAPRRGGRARAG